MRILQATSKFLPMRGGTQRVAADLALYLQEKGMDTRVLTRGGPKNSIDTIHRRYAGLKLIVIPDSASSWHEQLMSRVGVYPRTPDLKRGLEPLIDNVDILHFHDENELSLFVALDSLSAVHVMQYHTLDFSHTRLLMNPLNRRHLVSFGGRHIVPTEKSARLLRQLGVAEDRIVKIPPGIDDEFFTPQPSTERENRILFVGRLVPVKGCHVLLRALREVHIPLQVEIVGDSHRRRYLRRLRALAESLRKKSAHRISWRGFLQDDDLVRAYQRATLVVTPSLIEPFGLVNLEALACGTPVVSTNVGGVPEVLGNSFKECLVDPSDAKQLAVRIENLIEDREGLSRLGRLGRHHIETNFSWSVVLRKLLKLYREIIEMRGS